VIVFVMAMMVVTVAWGGWLAGIGKALVYSLG
jgi:hypothetical protein